MIFRGRFCAAIAAMTGGARHEAGAGKGDVMRSYEALSEVIGRETAECAEALGLKPITVNKWKEDPERSGTVNPLERVEMLTAKAVALGRGDAAFAAVRYLCRRFGFCAVPLPAGRPEFAGVADGLFSALREQSDFAAVSAEALRDREITPQERNRIEREAWEAQEAISGFLHLVRLAEGVGH